MEATSIFKNGIASIATCGKSKRNTSKVDPLETFLVNRIAVLDKQLDLANIIPQKTRLRLWNERDRRYCELAKHKKAISHARNR